jgi:hypothetical protein
MIFGIYLVRNEEDIIRTNILHHLSMGIDRILVIDNGSTDETGSILDDLARGGRVEWSRVNGTFHQSRLTTELAHEAFLQGADWVVPIDADEFWWARRGDLKTVLANASAGALQAQVLNFIQRREQSHATPDALLHMTRRAPVGIGPARRVQELVEAGQIAFVEIEYRGKWISRASLALEIAQGNHSVTGVRGPREQTDEIICLHAPLRARSVLEAKADAGRPLDEVEEYLGPAWHVGRWRTLALHDALDQEWIANSYADEALDVYGVRHGVIVDTTLRDVVQPWIGPAVAEPQPLRGSVGPTPYRLVLSSENRRQQMTPVGPTRTDQADVPCEAVDSSSELDPYIELMTARKRLARQELGVRQLREYFGRELASRDARLAEYDRRIRDLQAKRDALISRGERIRLQLANRDQRIAELQSDAAALREIQKSRTWRTVTAWWRLRRKLRRPERTPEA